MQLKYAQFRLIELVQKHLGTKLRRSAHSLTPTVDGKKSCTSFIGRLSYPIFVGLYIYIYESAFTSAHFSVARWDDFHPNSLRSSTANQMMMAQRSKQHLRMFEHCSSSCSSPNPCQDSRITQGSCHKAAHCCCELPRIWLSSQRPKDILLVHSCKADVFALSA